MADSFDDTWSMLERRLASRTRIPNWTRDKGYFGDDFDVELGTESLTVYAPGAANVQRVARGEFRLVHELWPGYLAGSVPRMHIREVTRHSKYIISVLHWPTKAD